ncbi:hypothetical protein HPB50_016192 [Hyalomma asiaticum]|uniref:Uncharacterized protein n=1 Tax=Hyalomma asiaticum TaxID=266040 RepID=A0ACB7S0H2_HYAAI|nr:hypothetical protein HPB50_016192 [Hyalomma asiaticum]
MFARRIHRRIQGALERFGKVGRVLERHITLVAFRLLPIRAKRIAECEKEDLLVRELFQVTYPVVVQSEVVDLYCSAKAGVRDFKACHGGKHSQRAPPGAIRRSPDVAFGFLGMQRTRSCLQPFSTHALDVHSDARFV